MCRVTAVHVNGSTIHFQDMFTSVCAGDNQAYRSIARDRAAQAADPAAPEASTRPTCNPLRIPRHLSHPLEPPLETNTDQALVVTDTKRHRKAPSRLVDEQEAVTPSHRPRRHRTASAATTPSTTPRRPARIATWKEFRESQIAAHPAFSPPARAAATIQTAVPTTPRNYDQKKRPASQPLSVTSVPPFTLPALPHFNVPAAPHFGVPFSAALFFQTTKPGQAVTTTKKSAASIHADADQEEEEEDDEDEAQPDDDDDDDEFEPDQVSDDSDA